MLLTWVPVGPILPSVNTFVASVLVLYTCILALHAPPHHWSEAAGISHAILPSLPGTILPESLPQLLTQDCRLPPEALELLILFG